MIWRWYKKIETFWFLQNRQLRFLLVGGFNTLTAFGAFVFLFSICGLPYQLAVILQFVFGVNLSILTMGYYVFGNLRHFRQSYVKGWCVYLSLLAANYLWMYLLADVAKVAVVPAQALFVIVSSIATYIVHRNITYAAKN